MDAAMPTTVHFLRWSDVDPEGRPFDPAPAREIAAERILGALEGDPARRSLAPGRNRESLEESIDRALIAAYGAWAAGWCWATSEPGGGGPVHGWCCADHSLLNEDDRSATASIDRVVAALAEWRAFLEELASVFAALHVATADLAIGDAVEHAAACLLPIIIQRTSTYDAWYATFAYVLDWYLESAGHDPDVVCPVVSKVIDGRFKSWVEPDAEAARTACAELGYKVALAAEDPPMRPDALAAWRSVRADAFEPAPAPRGREPVRHDAHRRYIDGPERARDPGRAARMAAALDACRASARRDEPLTFDRLSAWQAIVLGMPADFRATDAYAKGGRERYGLDAKTQRRFEAALDEASDAATAVSLRAARVYLDVCFFHPFDDGNARAARLALDHVVTRAGLSLHAVEPLFVVARSAGDRAGASSFAWLVEYFLGPSAG
jgi:prophage maintenance system killer protein